VRTGVIALRGGRLVWFAAATDFVAETESIRHRTHQISPFKKACSNVTLGAVPMTQNLFEDLNPQSTIMPNRKPVKTDRQPEAALLTPHP
jgi:hypothetical protein